MGSLRRVGEIMANRKNKQKRFYTLLVQVILVFMAVLALFPFLWMISTSLKGSEEHLPIRRN